MKLGFVVLLVASLAAQIGLRGHSATLHAVKLSGRTLLLVATCVCLVASLVARAQLDRFVFDVQGIGHAREALAYVVLRDNALSGARESDLAFLLSLLQTLLVGAVVYLVRDGRRTGPRFAIVAATMVAMLVVAGYDHTLKSPDVYAYVGFAKLGMAAFHPPHELFTGEYERINRFWGNPLVPCPYGPLWIAIARAAMWPAHSLAESILALRIVNVVAIASIVTMLARATKNFTLVAAFALNPAIIEEFVVDGHNDIVGVAFLFAALFAVRSPIAKIVLVAAAICVKLPFLLVGAVVFVNYASRRRRIGYFAAASAIGIAGSVGFAGPDFVRAVVLSTKMHAVPEPWVSVTHLLCVAVVLGAILRVFFVGRIAVGAAPAFVGLGVLPFPWYLIWALPVAAAAGTLAPMLVALPFITGLFSLFSYDPTPLRAISAVVAMGLVIVGAILVARARARAVQSVV